MKLGTLLIATLTLALTKGQNFFYNQDLSDYGQQAAPPYPHQESSYQYSPPSSLERYYSPTPPGTSQNEYHQPAPPAAQASPPPPPHPTPPPRKQPPPRYRQQEYQTQRSVRPFGLQESPPTPSLVPVRYVDVPVGQVPEGVHLPRDSLLNLFNGKDPEYVTLTEYGPQGSVLQAPVRPTRRHDSTTAAPPQETPRQENFDQQQQQIPASDDFQQVGVSRGQYAQPVSPRRRPAAVNDQPPVHRQYFQTPPRREYVQQSEPPRRQYVQQPAQPEPRRRQYVPPPETPRRQYAQPEAPRRQYVQQVARPEPPRRQHVQQAVQPEIPRRQHVQQVVQPEAPRRQHVQQVTQPEPPRRYHVQPPPVAAPQPSRRQYVQPPAPDPQLSPRQYVQPPPSQDIEVQRQRPRSKPRRRQQTQVAREPPQREAYHAPAPPPSQGYGEEDIVRRRPPASPPRYQSNVPAQRTHVQSRAPPQERRQQSSRPQPPPPANLAVQSLPDDTDGDGLPGEAGTDYPTLHVIPTTSFSCRDQSHNGYYADVETACQVVHLCQAGGVQSSFLCPNGTIFNQEKFSCQWWFKVRCEAAPSYYGLNDNLYKVPGAKDEEEDVDKKKK